MKWPDDWPILDLVYKLLTWIPVFQDDPEYQIYLEAITRSITQALAFSPYQGHILNKPPHRDRSRESIIRDILAAIAENVVDVDEELLTHTPRDHLNMMTIHQSKGLEFPLVIVDVGSAFATNHVKQRFKRFPEAASNVALMESDLSPYTEVGPLRIVRGDLDRTFEDLIRLYYVAYSRAQTVLLLVGHNKLLQGNTKIRNIATFWRQDGTWAWQRAGGTRPPATVAGHPLLEI
jgi:DNA helicase-2/ATP-dependent DNA helicase PcrA